jgi:hypothetical protein
MLMVSTTGEEYAYFVLNDALEPVRQDLPEALKSTVRMIDENCEPSLCTVLFMGGAGGSLRAGVTRNPVRLTRSVQGRETRLTAAERPAMSGPGAGSPSWST